MEPQTNKKRRSRYRLHNGKFCIDIQLRDWQQLFDSRDPAPFRDRDLDDDAVAYIVASLQEIPLKAGAKVVLNLPRETAAQVDEKMIRDAIHFHFDYERDLNRKKGRETLRQGQASLFVGLTCLAIFILLSHLIGKMSDGLLNKAFYEGLNIMGWVAMWRPIDTFLYQWWPYRRANAIFERLSKIEIDFLFS